MLLLSVGPRVFMNLANETASDDEWPIIYYVPTDIERERNNQQFEDDMERNRR